MASYNTYGVDTLPNRIRNMIIDLRKEHVESGGDYTTAPAFIRERGIRTVGFTIFVSDEIESYSILKYGGNR